MRIYYPENPKPKAPFLTQNKKKTTKKGGLAVNAQQHAVVLPLLMATNENAQVQEHDQSDTNDDRAAANRDPDSVLPSEVETTARNFGMNPQQLKLLNEKSSSSSLFVNPNNHLSSANVEGEIMKQLDDELVVLQDSNTPTTIREDYTTNGGNNKLDVTTTFVKKDIKREWELAPFREALEQFINSDDQFFVINHRPTSLPLINNMFTHDGGTMISKSSPKKHIIVASTSKHSILSLLRRPLSSNVTKLLLKGDEECSSGSEEEREQCRVKDQQQQQTMTPPQQQGIGITTHNTVEVQTVLSNTNWSLEEMMNDENKEQSQPPPPLLLNEQSLLGVPGDTVKEESNKVMIVDQNNPPRTRSIWDNNDSEDSTKRPTTGGLSNEIDLTNNTNNDENIPSSDDDDDDDKYDEESFQSYHTNKSDILVIKPLNNAAVVERPISLPSVQLLGDETDNATEDDVLQPHLSIGTADAISAEVKDDYNDVIVVHRQPQPFLQENKKGCAWVFDMNNNDNDDTEFIDDIRQEQSCSESEEDSEENYNSSFISEV
jgi:hypothetical protein